MEKRTRWTITQMTGCQKFSLKNIKSKYYWDECIVNRVAMGAFQVILETLDWGNQVENTKIFNINANGFFSKVAEYRD